MASILRKQSVNDIFLDQIIKTKSPNSAFAKNLRLLRVDLFLLVSLYLQVLVRCWLWKSPVVSVSRPGVQSLKYTWSYLGSGFKYFFMFTPTLGKWSKLTMIFFKSVETTNWLQVVQLTTVWQHWYWASQVAKHVNFHCHWRNHPWFLQCLLFNIRCAELTAPGAAQYQACSYIV